MYHVAQTVLITGPDVEDDLPPNPSRVVGVVCNIGAAEPEPPEAPAGNASTEEWEEFLVNNDVPLPDDPTRAELIEVWEDHLDGGLEVDFENVREEDLVYSVFIYDEPPVVRTFRPDSLSLVPTFQALG